MKRFYPTVMLSLLSLCLFSQQPDGTIAEDFNMVDINGNQHHLYSYLSQGKTVILDFSAAWCPLCWNYHNSNALKDFYTLYGPNGADKAMVLFIEKDPIMGLEDLQGITSATAGNWIAGTPYPIIDNSDANADYQPNALPTIYGIYPDKTRFHIGTLTTNELIDFVDAFEGSTGGADTIINVEVDEIQHVSCAGRSDGAIFLTVGGPAMEFSYAWNTGQTTQDISGLAVGTYRCTVTDNLQNIHVIDPIDITEPDTLGLLFLRNLPTSQTANNGTVLANVSGGTAPYNYIWNTGGTESSIEGLGEGTYSVQVIDDNGCQIQDSISLVVPDCSVIVSINAQATSCDQNPDGSVTILVDGGVPPISFAWNNGATTQNLTGLTSGGYEVTVSDAQGCETVASAMVGINDQNPPNPRIRDEPITLYLNAQGVVEISAEEVDSNSSDNCGILDMQIEQVVFDCSDVGRNFIEFTVVDNNLNLASRDVEIVVLDTLEPFFNCAPDITVSACDGIVNYEIPSVVDNCPNGSRMITAARGPGARFPEGTTEESYTYITRDGSSITCSFDVTVERVIEAELVTNDVRCTGGTDGSATVTIIDSDRPYGFSWSDGQQSDTATDLAVGDYTVTITDSAECTFIESFFIGEPAELQVRVDSIKAPDGRADVFITALGGTPPYRFIWTGEGGIVSTVEDPKNLAFGEYQVAVTDARGCAIEPVAIKADEITPSLETDVLHGLKILPNPTAGEFVIQFPTTATKPGRVEVMSLTGRSLYQQDFRIRDEVTVDPGALTQGLYLVRVSVADRYTTRRLVVR